MDHCNDMDCHGLSMTYLQSARSGLALFVFLTVFQDPLVSNPHRIILRKPAKVTPCFFVFPTTIQCGKKSRPCLSSHPLSQLFNPTETSIVDYPIFPMIFLSKPSFMADGSFYFWLCLMETFQDANQAKPISGFENPHLGSRPSHRAEAPRGSHPKCLVLGRWTSQHAGKNDSK